MKRIVRSVSLVAVLFIAATFVHAQVSPDVAQLTSPAPGSVLPGATVTFTWSPAPGGGDYFLQIGSLPFGTDIFNAVVRVTSVTLVNIPTNGGTVYLYLSTQVKGAWQGPLPYVFTATNAGTAAVTTLTVDNKAVAFSSTPQNVALTATVAAASPVNQGNVSFQVMDGASPLGAAVNSTAVTNGAVSAVYVLPAGTVPKSYTVQAIYSGGVGFRASSSAGTLTVNPASQAAVTLAATTNAASYGTTSIAPGEIVTLFGAGMGPAGVAGGAPDTSGLFPLSLAGTRVLFNGIPAPLIYTSDKQSAVVVPFEVAGQAAVQVLVEHNGIASAPVTVPVTNSMPGVFSADGSGSGQGAIQNADLSLNSAANPAAPGSVVVLYVSGLGRLNSQQLNGSLVVPPLPGLLTPATVTIGGRAAAVLYAGPAPFAIAGLYQINCVVPAGLPAGQTPVVVASDGRQSQPNLTVSIR